MRSSFFYNIKHIAKVILLLSMFFFVFTVSYRDVFAVSDNDAFEDTKDTEDLNDESIITGTCGTNVTWKYDTSTKVLTIIGNGAMNDYEYGKAPWWNLRDLVSKINFQGSLTRIGNNAFCDFDKISILSVPASLTSIGKNAFLDCANLGSVNLYGNVTDVESGAFMGCSSLGALRLGNQMKNIGAEAFEGGNYSVVEFPETLESIGVGAFGQKIVGGDTPYNRGKLTECYYPKKKVDWYALKIDENAIPEGVIIHCQDGDLGRTEPEKKEEEDPAYNTEVLTEKQKALIQAFVKRMYTKCLEREPDAVGLYDWTSQLEKGRIDGAALARGFVGSPEIYYKNLTDDEYMNMLYHTFFDREPDPEGKAYWLSELQKGRSRVGVLSGFVNSREFSDLCDHYGIARGTMEEDGSSLYNAGARNFVLRLYQVALDRRGEAMGVEDWTHRINTGQMPPTIVARTFFDSLEYMNKHTTNEAYVEDLYLTFLGRKPDVNGKNAWVDKLNSGSSRQEIMTGFADSKEFKNIMAEYGLK